MDFWKDVAVPVCLLVVGIFGKWIANWEWDDDFALMGPDLIWAGIGAGIAHAIDCASILFNDLAKQTDVVASGRKLAWTAAFLVCSGFLYLVLLKMHQIIDPSMSPTRKQRLTWGAGVGNLVGLATMAALLFLLRRP